MLVSFGIGALLVMCYCWTLVVGALACVAQLVEGVIFLVLIIAAIDGPGTLIYATLFFALPVFGLIGCVVLLVQERRERAEEIGGSFRITSAGNGTLVEAWLPLG